MRIAARPRHEVEKTQARPTSIVCLPNPVDKRSPCKLNFTQMIKAVPGACFLVVSCITVIAQSGQSPLAPPKLSAPTTSGGLLKVGAKAPDFALPNGDGKLVTLSEYTSRSPVVLVFYRGFW